MSQKKQVTFEECMENVQTYIKRPENIELIQKAYDFAYEHHKGQFRLHFSITSPAFTKCRIIVLLASKYLMRMSS